MVARDATGAAAEPPNGETPPDQRPVMLVPVFSGSDVRAAAHVLRAVARARAADVLLLDLEQPVHGRRVEDRQAWLEERRVALAAPDLEVRAEHQIGHNLTGMIAEAVAERSPDLLLITWQRRTGRRALVDQMKLDDLLVDVPCDLLVLGLDGDVPAPRRVAVVLDDDAGNAVRDTAIAIADAIDGTVTFMAIADDDRAAQVARLEAEIKALPDPSRGAMRVIEARSPAAGILQNASPEEVDLLVVGTPPSGIIHRLAIGSMTERVMRRASVPVLVVKPRRSAAHSALSRMADVIFDVVPALNEAAKAEVYRTVRTAARGNVDFYVMMALASAIAALGLLLNSPAVVIGGMLVAPLMAPLVALGLGIVQGDARLLRLSLSSALRGSLLSVAISVIVATVIPNASLTTEVLSRTEPSLLDLVVAFAAGAAGAYALTREHLSAALPGVAIAAALVPPLAAVGVALALLDPGAAGGAALLFVANLVAIASAAGVVFFLVGFRPEPEHAPRIKLFSRAFTALALLAISVAVPLTWLTVQSVREATIERNTRGALDEAVAQFDGVRWSSLEIGSADGGTLRVTVEMETPEPFTPEQVSIIEHRLEARLDRPVELAVRVIQVTEVHGTAPGSAASPTPTPVAGGG